MKEDEAEQLRQLAERLLDLSHSQSEGLMFRNEPDDTPLIDLIQPPPKLHSDACLYRAARSEAERRRLRKQFMPAAWFSEGPWNILVDLFENEHCGRVVSITDACIAADVPMTTAIRHIGQLLEADLVHRSPDPKDARRAFLRLTHKGAAIMREVLGTMLDAEISIRQRLENGRGKQK